MSRSNSTPTPALPNGAIVLFQHGYSSNGRAHEDLVYNLTKARPSQIKSVANIMSQNNLHRFNETTLFANNPDKTILIKTEFSDNRGFIEFQVYELKLMIDRIQSVLGTSRPIYLVGHSKGGLVNMRFSLTYPGVVKKLISVGTPYNLNMLAFAQGVLAEVLDHDLFKAALDLSWKGKLALEGVNFLMDQYVTDKDLSSPATYAALRTHWNNSRNKPHLTAIGCSQIGTSADPKAGGDIIVPYTAQVADGYKDVVKVELSDRYIKVFPDNLWGWLKLSVNKVEQLRDIIDGFASGEPLTMLLGIILSAFVSNNDKPSTYDLIHTRQLSNKDVCLEVLKAFDRVSLPPSLPMYSNVTY